MPSAYYGPGGLFATARGEQEGAAVGGKGNSSAAAAGGLSDQRARAEEAASPSVDATPAPTPTPRERGPGVQGDEGGEGGGGGGADVATIGVSFNQQRGGFQVSRTFHRTNMPFVTSYLNLSALYYMFPRLLSPCEDVNTHARVPALTRVTYPFSSSL
jgi:hypothetical protein